MKIKNFFLISFFVCYVFCSQSVSEAANEAETIEVFNAFGHETHVSREDWRKKILPKQFEEHWNNSDKLYNHIVFAVEDGFYEESLEAAKHLMETDTIPERGLSLYSIVLMKLEKFSEAENILSNFIREEGATGILLTNLAKSLWEQGRKEEAKELIWKGLELDPNQENALAWWISLQEQMGDLDFYANTLRKLAKIEGSWRPQLWLGQHILDHGDLSEAFPYYEHVLKFASEDGEILMAVSGDLGSRGYAEEAIRAIEGIYDPSKHGIEPGINLLQAYVETDQMVKGKALIEQLRSLEEHGFNQHLDDYERTFNILGTPVQSRNRMRS